MLAGADKLKEKILEEAMLSAEKNRKAAEDEASRIISEARKTANDMSSNIIEKAEREAQEKRNRIISASELESRKMRLQAKQEILEEAFQKSIEGLNSIPQDKYVDVLTSLITKNIYKGTYEILLSDVDKAKFGASLVSKVNEFLKKSSVDAELEMSSLPSNIKSGFILKHGDTEINSSFEAVVKAQRDELEAEVVKALF